MQSKRVTRSYLRKRSGIALAILLVAGLSAFFVTFVGHSVADRRSENVLSSSKLLASLAELSLAFEELEKDPAKLKAVVARGRIRRSATEAEEALIEIKQVKTQAAFSPEAQRILAQPSLNPLVDLKDLLFVAKRLAAADHAMSDTEVSKAAALASKLSQRLLPVILQVNKAEARAGQQASNTHMFYAFLGIAAAVFGMAVAVRFVYLPMERFVIRARNEIETNRQKAETASEAKSAFLATMSHEIRTPLNGVLGLAELLQGTDLDAEQRRMVHLMTASGNSLLRILNDVLDFSKVESGNFALETEVFDVHSLCQEVTELFAAQAAKKRIKLHLTARPETANFHVRGPGKAVRQIVLNLVSNAVKFTERGSVTLAVQALPAQEGAENQYRIVVRDTGIGIAPEAKDLIFEQFTQADASASTRFGGTGLGLAIVKRLAKGINGEISVNSTVGAGSEFSLVFSAEAGPALAGAPEQKMAPVSFDKKILVADDNRVNRMVAGKLVERLGCVVNFATNGAEAVELNKTWMPDLILMDVRMPEMDGLDATRAIRAREREYALPTVPIIGLSANAMYEHRHEGLSAGMCDYLAKPVNKTALASSFARIWPEDNRHPSERVTQCA